MQAGRLRSQAYSNLNGCVHVIAAGGGGGLAVVFGAWFLVIGQLALSRFGEYHLGDGHAGMQPDGASTNVDNFQGNLRRRVTETSIDKTSGNVHHNAKASEARLSS